MLELEIPNGVEVNLEGNVLVIKGKLGSTTKKISTKYTPMQIADGKIKISEAANKKAAKQSLLIQQALGTELKAAFDGVQNGVTKKLQIIFAHFPISMEAKGKYVLIKNIFGEKVPRKAKIIGETKIATKGQELTITGVDPYDVSQTAANIRHACRMPKFDSRVFQDGVYPVKEE